MSPLWLVLLALLRPTPAGCSPEPDLARLSPGDAVLAPSDASRAWRRLDGLSDLVEGGAVLEVSDARAGELTAANLTLWSNTTIPKDAVFSLVLSGSFCDQLSIASEASIAGVKGSVTASAELSTVSFARQGGSTVNEFGTNVTISFSSLLNPWPLGRVLPSVLEVTSAGSGEVFEELEVVGYEVVTHVSTYIGGYGSLLNDSKWDAGVSPQGRSEVLLPASDEREVVTVEDDVAVSMWRLQGPNPGGAHSLVFKAGTTDDPVSVSVGADVPLCSLRSRPSVSSINNLQGLEKLPIGPVGFTVADDDMRLDLLLISLVVEDEEVLHSSMDVAFSGADAEREMLLVPRGPGITDATLRVYNEHKAASAVFRLTVGAIGAINMTFVDEAAGSFFKGNPRVLIDTPYEVTVLTPASVGPTEILVELLHELGDCRLDTSETGAFEDTSVLLSMSNGVAEVPLWFLCNEVDLTGSALSAIQTYGVNELTNVTSTLQVIAVDVPDQLTGLVVAAGNNFAELSWTNHFDGGLVVTNFTVSASDGSKFYFAPEETDPVAVIAPLVNGVQLTFTVAAHNDVGVSPESVSSGRVLPQSQLAVTLGSVNVVVGRPIAIQVAAVNTPLVSLTVGLHADGSMTLTGQLTLQPGALTVAGSFVAQERGSLLPVTLDLGGDSELEYAVPAPVYINAECDTFLDGLECGDCAADAYRNPATLACAGCPDNAECAGGETVPVPVAGFYSNEAGSILACNPASACQGGFGTVTCTAGYQGTRCSQCSNQFYRASGECFQCPKVQAWVIVVGIIVILICLGLFGAAMLIVMDLVVELPELSLAFPVVAMAIDYCQVVSLLSQSDIWPYDISVALRFFTLFRFNIDVLSAECAGLDYTARWMLVELTPVVLTGALVVYLLVHKFFVAVRAFVRRVLAPPVARFRTWLAGLPYVVRAVPTLLLFPILDPNCIPREAMRLFCRVAHPKLNKMGGSLMRGLSNPDKIIGLWVDFMQLAYLGCTSKTMEAFDCVRQEDGTGVMEAAPDNTCVGPPFGATPAADVDTTVHANLLPMATTSLVMYTFGMPLAAWLVLRRVEVPSDEELEQAVANSETSEALTLKVRQFERYGRMFTRYRLRPSSERHSSLVVKDRVEWPRYWVVVLMAKKSILVMLTTMFTSNPSMQFSSMCFIIVVLWTFSVRVRPYVDSWTLMQREKNNRILAKTRSAPAKKINQVAPAPPPPGPEEAKEAKEEQEEKKEEEEEDLPANMQRLALRNVRRVRRNIRTKSPLTKLRLNRMESVLHGCVFLVLLAALLFHAESWRSDWERALVTFLVLGLLLLSGVLVVLVVVVPLLAVWHNSIKRNYTRLQAIARHFRPTFVKRGRRSGQVGPAPTSVAVTTEPVVPGPPLKKYLRAVVPVSKHLAVPATAAAGPAGWATGPPLSLAPAAAPAPPPAYVLPNVLLGPPVDEEALEQLRALTRPSTATRPAATPSSPTPSSPTPSSPAKNQVAPAPTATSQGGEQKEY